MVRKSGKRTIAAMRRGIKRRNMARSRQFYGKGVRQPVQYFTRTQYQTAQVTITPGAAAFGQAIDFQLNRVPNYTEFTGLYDQYCIKGVKVTLIPRFTELSLGAAQIGNVWSVLDYDDNATPATVSQLLQYQNLKRTQMNKIHSRYLKPAISQATFAPAGVVAYTVAKNKWIDVTYDTTTHFGVKLWFDGIPAASSPVIFDATVKYYLAFKNVR